MHEPTDNLTSDERHLLQALADQAPPAPTAALIRARLASRRGRRMWLASSAAVAAVLLIAVAAVWVASTSPPPMHRVPPIAEDSPRPNGDGTSESNDSNGPPPSENVGVDAPQAAPERTVQPIPADESVAGACSRMAVWLDTVGATRALISKFPGDGISISVSGANVPPTPELVADLELLLAHFDLVEVELTDRGITCSLTQLH